MTDPLFEPIVINWTRFARQTVESIRAAVGPEFPLIARMNGNDFMPE